jgi:PadR family transcriptional regulator PadR
MNIQLKKGIVEICVLAVIRREPSYGYKIINDLSEIIEISESTLYPILRRLESQNFLETFNQEFKGRTRKYYKITHEGNDKIKSFIREWKDMERVYKFIMLKGDII